jgi:hypothetical protein
MGCLNESLNEKVPVIIKPKNPDIKAKAINFEKNLYSGGGIAKGTCILTNYGYADGYATLALGGDFSGKVDEKTVFVPAQTSVLENVRFFIRSEDTEFGCHVIGQSKTSLS